MLKVALIATGFGMIVVGNLLLMWVALMNK